MRFICKASDDHNITFYNTEDETPVLIIEPDSFEVRDGEIVFNVDEEVSRRILELLSK